MAATPHPQSGGADPRRFLHSFVATLLLALALVVLLNRLVDPLWHFGGNQVGGPNFAFNERISKANAFLRAGPESFDCLILGSSRATLMRAQDLAGYRCFNFAFSAAQPEEMLAFARYARAMGTRPRLLLVGVDARDFATHPHDLAIPPFVLAQREPPAWWRDYLSIDALLFSLRTLIDDSPLPRQYNAALEATIRPDAPVFAPPACVMRRPQPTPYVGQRLQVYRELRAVFPEARAVGFVPPVSVWDMAPLHFEGTLDSYATTLSAAATIFDRFHDFALPSAATADTAVTYDGEHYSPVLHTRLAQRLLAPETEADPSRVWAPQDYARRLRTALGQWIETLGIEAGPPADCPRSAAIWLDRRA